MPAVIETKEIGISLGVGKGTFYNVEFVSGKLQLEKNNGTYKKEGYWVSEVMDIEGKFREYDKLALSKKQFTKDYYKVETRTSDDGQNFNDYAAITAGGSIMSPKKRYIQVKITFYAGMIEEFVQLFEFNDSDEVNEWHENDYITTENGLRLKTDYQYDMTQDTSWNEDGTLLRQLVEVAKFKQINSLELE